MLIIFSEIFRKSISVEFPGLYPRFEKLDAKSQSYGSIVKVGNATKLRICRLQNLGCSLCNETDYIKVGR